MQEFSECVPCECGYGAIRNTICNSKNGQCHCSGESTGQRCDRCSANNFFEEQKNLYNTNLSLKKMASKNNFVKSKIGLQLDLNTLKCVSLKNRCPSIIEYGIQWKSTKRGTIAKEVLYFFLI